MTSILIFVAYIILGHLIVFFLCKRMFDKEDDLFMIAVTSIVMVIFWPVFIYAFIIKINIRN